MSEAARRHDAGAFLSAVLCLLATLPFGAAAAWARAGVAAGCLLVASYAFFILRAPSAPRQVRAFRSGLLFLLLLAGWIALQTASAPVALLKTLQPRAAQAYDFILPLARQTTVSLDPGASLSCATLWLAYLLLAWSCSVFLASGTTATRFLFCLAGIGTLQAFWGLIARGAAPHLAGAFFKGERAVATFSSGNSFGGYMALTLPLTLGALLAIARPATRPRNETTPPAGNRMIAGTLLTVAAAIQAAALVLSGSRGALAAGTISCAWMAATSLWRGAARNSRYGLCALAAGLVTVLLLGSGGAFTPTARRVMALLEPNGDRISRLDIWAACRFMFATFPLGVGPGCFGEGFSPHQPAGFAPQRVFHAHNDYIEIACELGIVGSAALLGLLACWIAAVRRTAGRHAALRRAMLAAIAAGMTHALVDFNISSRPGVALLFFALLGGAVAAPSAPEPEQPAMRRSRLRCLGILLCLTLAAGQIRAAVANWLRGSGESALGLDEDDYFWLRRPAMDTTAALRALARARRLLPASPEVMASHGMAKAAAIEAAVEAAVTESAKSLPGIEKSDLFREVRAAMRTELASAYRDGERDLERAVSLAPWKADLRIRHARSLCELTRLAAGPDEAAPLAERLVAELRRAAWLGPTRTGILVPACALAALAADSLPDVPRRAELTDIARDCGIRAVALHPARLTRVLPCWRLAGIDGEALFADDRVPPDALRRAYRLLTEGSEDGARCLRLLDALEAACRRHLPKAHAAMAVPCADFAIEEQAVRERARWLLRTGRWSDYRTLQRRRRAVFRNLIAASIENLAEYPRRLHLLKLETFTGLDAVHRLELAALSIESGDVAPADSILAEAAFDNETPMPLLLEWRPGADVGLGGDLMRCRTLQARGEHAAAVAAIRSLLAKNKIPWRFQHRARLLLARSLAEMNCIPEAAQALREAVAACPGDRDVRQAVEDLRRRPAGRDLLSEVPTHNAAYVPDNALGVRFLGGRVELDGFSLAAEADSSHRLRVYWRFKGGVPADLAFAVYAGPCKGPSAWGRTIPFRKADRAAFSAGEPRFGDVFPVDVLIPAAAGQAGSRRLAIALSGEGGRSLPSEEGLGVVEMWDWPGHSTAHAKPAAE
ncbi:MAG: O-antigen ligase family protein [Lentisphaerae bacterium]|nr:O-antigen ligase family protein [Lentisphaerota bacterium]